MDRKYSLALAALAFAGLLLGGCSQGFGGRDAMAATDKAVVVPEDPSRPSGDDYEKAWAYRDENQVSEDFQKSLGQFAYRTASEILNGSGENGNYSPVSLYYGLALAAEGAGGETAGQMQKLLGVQGADTLAEQCGRLYRYLYRDEDTAKLKIANSLWLSNRYPFHQEYLDIAAKDYYSSLYSVDFADEATGKLMGEWVREHTNGTISPEIQTEGNRVMSIFNTIYLYDEWRDRFDADKTKEDLFYPEQGEPQKVDFMNASFASHGFTRGDGYMRSSLGLKENGSMVFVLPDEGMTVDQLLASPERLQEALTAGENQMGIVEFKVPKFTLDCEYQLKDYLEKLGMKDAFTGEADFSGITDNTAFISEIIQQTHIAIDENGVEASSFTEIGYAGGALPTERADMILNRPFIYAIMPYGDVPLFVGVYRGVE